MRNAGRATALVAALTLMTGCGMGDEEEQERALRATRDQVNAEMTALLEQVTGRLGARMRFSQGNYDSCGSTLDGAATAYSYRVNGRIDLTGPPSAAATEAAVEQAGWAVDERGEGRVSASLDGLTVTFSSLAGSTREQAWLFSGGSDECYEIGRERAEKFSAERDPLG